jgi:hypothetical protein
VTALASPPILVLLAFLAAPACSSKSARDAGAAGAAATAGGAGVGGAGGGDADGAATYVGGCPATLPTNASACEAAGRTCTYGDAPRGECRDSAVCSDGRWSVQAGACPVASVAALCPVAAPAPGQACATDKQLCAYPGGTECQCFGGTISNIGWVCDVPLNTGGDCPRTPPNAGTACTGTTACTYYCRPLTGSAVLARCVESVWRWDLMPCGTTNSPP